MEAKINHNLRSKCKTKLKRKKLWQRYFIIYTYKPRLNIYDILIQVKRNFPSQFPFILVQVNFRKAPSFMIEQKTQFKIFESILASGI